MNEVLMELSNRIDWDRLCELASPAEPSAGFLDHDPEVLIKLMFLQRMYQLGEAAVIHQAADRLSFREFLGLGPSNKMPGESDLVNFRRLLRDYDVYEPLIKAMDQPLAGQGIIIEDGWITITEPQLIRKAPPTKAPGTRDAEPLRAGEGITPHQHPLDPDAAFWLEMGQIDQIRGYRIQHALASGSVATVFKAVHTFSEREVALKVILPSKTSGETLSRFVLETQVMSQLDHPGIAKVYDSGMFETDAGMRPYLVMEFIRGRIPTEFAKENGFNPRQRLALLAKMCEAVDYVHSRGIIHRDLKPANILVEANGQPKILDFGLARVSSGVRSQRVQTAPGQILGTLDFMSPEQAAGKSGELDARVDVYALGAIGYLLLAGRPPLNIKFKGVVEALKIIAEAVPEPLGAIDPDYQDALEAIFARVLEKDKNLRHESARAFYEDLLRYLKVPIRA